MVINYVSCFFLMHIIECWNYSQVQKTFRDLEESNILCPYMSDAIKEISKACRAFEAKESAPPVVGKLISPSWRILLSVKRFQVIAPVINSYGIAHTSVWGHKNLYIEALFFDACYNWEDNTRWDLDPSIYLRKEQISIYNFFLASDFPINSHICNGSDQYVSYRCCEMLFVCLNITVHVS